MLAMPHFCRRPCALAAAKSASMDGSSFIALLFRIRQSLRRDRLLLAEHAEVVVRVEEARIELERLSLLRNRLVVAAGVDKACCQIRVDDRRQRIELDRAFALSDCLFECPSADQRSLPYQ